MRLEPLSSVAATVHPSRPGKSGSDIRHMLVAAGLRPTRQRLMLGLALFGKGDRHVCAETLFEEVKRQKLPVSLATVYNTLRQFADAGLVRHVATHAAKSYFDTNLGDHHHYLVDGEDEVLDIPHSMITVDGLPDVPEGFEMVRCDVVVRLRRKAGA